MWLSYSLIGGQSGAVSMPFALPNNCPSGIYAIYGPNGRVYIGQSTNIRARWAWHTEDLNTRKHPNPYLQNAWRKHGPSQFRFAVLERVISKRRHLLNAEARWMQAHIKSGWLLYNCNVRNPRSVKKPILKVRLADHKRKTFASIRSG